MQVLTKRCALADHGRQADGDARLSASIPPRWSCASRKRPPGASGSPGPSRAKRLGARPAAPRRTPAAAWAGRVPVDVPPTGLRVGDRLLTDGHLVVETKALGTRLPRQGSHPPDHRSRRNPGPIRPWRPRQVTPGPASPSPVVEARPLGTARAVGEGLVVAPLRGGVDFGLRRIHGDVGPGVDDARWVVDRPQRPRPERDGGGRAQTWRSEKSAFATACDAVAAAPVKRRARSFPFHAGAAPAVSGVPAGRDGDDEGRDRGRRYDSDGPPAGRHDLGSAEAVDRATATPSTLALGMRFNGMAGMVEERYALPSSWHEMMPLWGLAGRGGSRRMRSYQTIKGEPDCNTAPQLPRL
ncbi:hypothetical protein SLAV_01540 [Streptomyces lavendulae subsp. lavendulae]|uniref:Uncharacterized protein n=1 Tax=Streptomyces lavendulae subsp. lavendulae TaxID=58340 RepID=A0A2K8P665_STRLA|nr:hypothetical protein SLAV_01540 [Streptomyces lavendulae subsp. lavendulae]